MAAKLNKTRIRDTRIVVILCFAIILLTRMVFDHDDDAIHEPIDFFGAFLVSLCAIGRLYCTAFLGGFKNNEIVDYGPFSICRNPLYFFSFIGIVGISFMSVNIAVLIILPASFLFIYMSLIKREEEYLENKFGDVYKKYKKKTPRFWPKLSLYHAPHAVQMTPKTMLKGLKDSLMWFAAYPLIELIKYIQDEGILKPLIYIHI